MTTKTGTISTVGGVAIPPVDNWIAGFQQGALSVNPDINLLNAYSQDFNDQAKCKEIGIDQIAQGSDVVFQVAGLCGLGALDAAGEGEASGSAPTPTSRPGRLRAYACAQATSRVGDRSWVSGGPKRTFARSPIATTSR